MISQKKPASEAGFIVLKKDQMSETDDEMMREYLNQDFGKRAKALKEQEEEIWQREMAFADHKDEIAEENQRQVDEIREDRHQLEREVQD